jgi:hypothetical protein
MKANRAQIGTTLLILSVLPSLVVATLTSANEPNYTLDWWTVDGGGETIGSGIYVLQGTVGQPDGGVLSGGGYVLSGGFWGGGSGAVEYDVYLPLVLRNYP